MPDSIRGNINPCTPKLGKTDTCHAVHDPLTEVVKACQEGVHEAHRQLYDACHQNVFRLAARIVGLQEAADVSQSVFLQAFRSIGKFSGRSCIETWMYRLTVNESLQYLRRNRRWRFQVLDWEPMHESRHQDASEGKELLQFALGRIAPELRSIFLLREIEGLTYSDIAEVLQIPEGTVGSRLNRARRDLKNELSTMGLEL